jgi:hypothetical protein
MTSRATKKEPTNNQRTTTIKESKHVNKEEKNYTSPASPVDCDQSSLVLEAEFCEKPKLADLQEKWFLEEFWPIFWRKQGKEKSLKAFRKHAKTSEVKDGILTAVKNHSPLYHLRDPEHRPLAATWLNDRRYNEPFDASAPRFEINQPSKRRENLSEALRMVKDQRGEA